MRNIAPYLYEYVFNSPLKTSSLFTFLYVALLSQQNSPKITRDFLAEYDYVVIGSGAGGATVAARLSEKKCVNVLVLEAGDEPPKFTEVPAIANSFRGSVIDWGFYSIPQKNTARLLKDNKVNFPAGKVIGGSTAINGMQYVRGSPRIYDYWEAEGAKGWSYRDILQYFIKAEANGNPESVDPDYHGFHGPVSVETPNFGSIYKSAFMSAFEELGYRPIDIHSGPTPIGMYECQFTTREGRRCSVAKAYLVPAAFRSNLHIVKNAFVKKIIIRGKQAVGVEFDYEGMQYQVFARREVIISAGTFNTAKLLMLSGIGPAKILRRYGIPVVQDLPVGFNLHDHIKSINHYYTDKIPPSYMSVTDPKNIEYYVYTGAGPLSATKRQVNAHLRKENSTGPPDIPDYQVVLSFTTSSFVYGPEVRLDEQAFKTIYGPYENKSLVACESYLLRPRSRGYVNIQSNDPYDPPYIEPNFFDVHEDIEDIVAGLKMCDRLIKTKALRYLGVKPLKTHIPGCKMFDKNTDDYLECHVRSIILAGIHQVGTAKMGKVDDPTTVVDEKLRVKGIIGLRIVDASIMPIVPSGNIMAPTIMIGEKAADMIKETINYC